ncbi:aminotransferase class I/II-fold pyridoxal phosphate-dependent enzyme [Lentilitoribacter sp. Alg239-R112]|uniref:DegT/DnrJ/EryC1/StrS family aminotransferase n=1 Tax=Lentilitoribacter sp. Alg239-R112 TaxID=2305987 RepID=UPI0013A69C0F|nr:aminotransferase class I/II-fold pyridoxal phosphate-dependent enzyme [Lentilitoribacter sp. Alg239-R112]
MPKLQFKKPFTQQEAISEDAISAAVKVMKTGRLHRYNMVEGEDSEVNLLEEEYATYQDTKYCLATSSGGGAMQIALRAIGVKPGDRVATNAFTLAPVPGAIAAVGASPVYIETTENLTIDLDDLKDKLMISGARYLLLSHMRGHIAPMEQLIEILDDLGVKMIEDCAHTMGAEWNGIKSGNFGSISCFSAQTYKHINSGEGGLLTTNDDELMARAIILSGSYMLYEKHKARPDMEAFERARFDMPNCSSRMDNLRAAILRPQLSQLELNIARWNARYQILEKALRDVSSLTLPLRPEEELYVGSSIQFLVPEWSDVQIKQFIKNCADRGVELKWFGDANPVGFTSRYDSWRYALAPKLDQTLEILHRLIDMRVPLSFEEDDCSLIAQIIKEEFENITS